MDNENLSSLVKSKHPRNEDAQVDSGVGDTDRGSDQTALGTGPRVGTKATSRTVRAAASPEPAGQSESRGFWKHVSVREGWVLVVGVVMPKQHGCHVFPSNTKGPLEFPRGGPLCLVLRRGADGISALKMRDSVLQLRCQVVVLSTTRSMDPRTSLVWQTLYLRESGTEPSSQQSLPFHQTELIQKELASNHGPRHPRARNGRRIHF